MNKIVSYHFCDITQNDVVKSERYQERVSHVRKGHKFINGIDEYEVEDIFCIAYPDLEVYIVWIAKTKSNENENKEETK